jgi:hypothetical protein
MMKMESHIMKNSMTDQQQHFVLYSSADGNIHVDVILQDENVWLTQKAMGLLFGVESHTITYHLKEIFRSGELDEKATTRKIRAVQNEGKRQVTRELDFYNLDAIISVGYRVNSYQATQFRIWATKTLKDQKITDIYALAADYDKNALITKDFFATVQNKLHWAITGKTAAEIIYDSVDATKPHMGLTSWKQAPDGKILMKMQDGFQFLHSFLELSNYPVLLDKNYISDFDKVIQCITEGKYDWK